MTGARVTGNPSSTVNEENCLILNKPMPNSEAVALKAGKPSKRCSPVVIPLAVWCVMG